MFMVKPRQFCSGVLLHILFKIQKMLPQDCSVDVNHANSGHVMFCTFSDLDCAGEILLK